MGGGAQRGWGGGRVLEGWWEGLGGSWRARGCIGSQWSQGSRSRVSRVKGLGSRVSRSQEGLGGARRSRGGAEGWWEGAPSADGVVGGSWRGGGRVSEGLGGPEGLGGREDRGGGARSLSGRLSGRRSGRLCGSRTCTHTPTFSLTHQPSLYSSVHRDEAYGAVLRHTALASPKLYGAVLRHTALASPKLFAALSSAVRRVHRAWVFAWSPPLHTRRCDGRAR